MINSILIFAAWTVVMAVSVKYALSPNLLFQSETDEQIAQVSFLKGRVQLKADSHAVWDYANQGQGLASGNVIATGPDGKAILTFTGGKTIEVSESSQVVISAGSEQKNRFELQLVKGLIAAKISKQSASKTQLVLRAGEAEIASSGKTETSFVVKKEANVAQPTIAVEKGDDIELTKGSIDIALPSGKTRRIEHKSKQLAVALPTVKVDLSKPAMLELKRRREPENTTPKFQLKPIVAKKVVYPRILNLPQGRYWQYEGLGDSRPPPLPIRVATSANNDGRKSYLSLRKRGSTQRIALRPGRRSYKISGRLIQKYARRVSEGRYQLAVYPGVEDESLGTPVRFELLSLKELAGARAVEIALADATFKETPSKWHLAGDLSPQAATTRIYLNRAEELKKLLPLLVKAGRFNVTPLATIPEKSTYWLVTKGQVTASLSVSGAGKKRQLAKIKKLLGATSHFSGKRESLVDNWSKLAKDSQALRSYPKPELFIHDGKKIQKVNKSFLENNRRARRYIFRDAEAVFSEPVSVDKMSH